MNSGGPSAGGLNGASRALEREEKSHERDGEQAAALWVALAQKVTTAQALPLSQIEPPNAWRPSAGDLTPGPSSAGVLGGTAGQPSDSERMTLRVDGGSLGELEVTLERQDGALRVVIGMENKHLVGSVLPDAAVLRSALEGAGITVQSLNVVPQAEVGTVLAQRRLSPSGPKPAADEATGDENDKGQKKSNRKRLTLIG